jgi:hypothetical protein
MGAAPKKTAAVSAGRADANSSGNPSYFRDRTDLRQDAAGTRDVATPSLLPVVVEQPIAERREEPQATTRRHQTT